MNHQEVIKNKIVTREELAQRVARWKFFGKKIAFTNGCFDVLHLGHISYLAGAADCGDVLIVGLNSNESVKRMNKSPNRPLQDVESRSLTVAALGFVKAVVVFDEDTPLELIRSVMPDVLVKGGNYDPAQTDPSSPTFMVGSDLVRKSGGEVLVLPYVQGYSTTAVEKKILNT